MGYTLQNKVNLCKHYFARVRAKAGRVSVQSLPYLATPRYLATAPDTVQILPAPEYAHDTEFNATESRRLKEAGHEAIAHAGTPLPTAAQRKAELGY
jgi:hypothetical protein